MKETITAALAIPFVIVSTWFGVQSVNNHFEHQTLVHEQELRVDERRKVAEYWECVQRTMTPEERAKYSDFCIRPTDRP